MQSSGVRKKKLDDRIVESKSKMDRWKTCDFTSSLIVISGGWVIMKGCVP